MGGRFCPAKIVYHTTVTTEQLSANFICKRLPFIHSIPTRTMPMTKPKRSFLFIKQYYRLSAVQDTPLSRVISVKFGPPRRRGATVHQTSAGRQSKIRFIIGTFCKMNSCSKKTLLPWIRLCSPRYRSSMPHVTTVISGKLPYRN